LKRGLMKKAYSRYKERERDRRERERERIFSRKAFKKLKTRLVTLNLFSTFIDFKSTIFSYKLCLFGCL
jgi:hypothetical protein